MASDVCFKPKDDQNVLMVSQWSPHTCICYLDSLSSCNCLHQNNPQGFYKMTKERLCIRNPINGMKFYVAKSKRMNWSHCFEICPNFSIDNIEAIEVKLFNSK